jgi:hypothetical protein
MLSLQRYPCNVILATLTLQRYPCNVNLIPPSRLVVRMRVYVLSFITLRCCYLSVCLLCWSGCVAVVLIAGICALPFGFAGDIALQALLTSVEVASRA